MVVEASATDFVRCAGGSEHECSYSDSCSCSCYACQHPMLGFYYASVHDAYAEAVIGGMLLVLSLLLSAEA